MYILLKLFSYNLIDNSYTVALIIANNVLVAKNILLTVFKLPSIEIEILFFVYIDV